MRRMTRRNALATLGTSAALSGCRFTTGERSIAQLGLGKAPAPGRPVEIEIYSVWGGSIGQGWVEAARRYEEVRADVGVRVTYAPASSANQQPKLFTAIAGDQGPDIAQIGRYQAPQWARLGIMTDLTPYFEASGLAESDFLPLAFRDMRFDGRVWQVAWQADANFPFFWNQDLFESAGLDPDHPPATVAEAHEMSRRITQRSGGRITRIGLIPWDQYGVANALYTWGWAFGGTFYDAERDEVTPDDEYVVKALEWIVGFAKEVGGADNVSVAPPGLTLHYFGSGNVGMSALVSANYADIRAAEPDMNIGTTGWPYQPPGATRAGAGAWLSGRAAFIPTGSKQPQAAWDFIQWFAATEDGTSVLYQGTQLPPVYLKSPVLQRIKSDPVGKPFRDVMFSATHSRPAMAVADFYTAQLEELGSRALYGELTPYAAMRKVKQATQTELRRFLRETRMPG